MMVRALPLLLLDVLCFFATMTWTTTTAETSSSGLVVEVYGGPSANGGSCPSDEETIHVGDYAKIHFTVSIDASSKKGMIGKVYESTRTDGNPIGVTLGHGEVINAWDEGLIGLCTGDKVHLTAPSHLAYGEDGTGSGEDDIPGGATVLFDIEIVSVTAGMTEEEDDAAAQLMFDKGDTNKDGKLSRAEFDEMFASQIGDVSDPEELVAVQHQLDQFWGGQDVDKDGFLSLEEFLQPSHFDHHEDPTPEEEFAMMDKDGDGKLSSAEIDAFFADLGQEVPVDFWIHMDEDKDGFITFDEFFVDTADDSDEDEYYEDEVEDEL